MICLPFEKTVDYRIRDPNYRTIGYRTAEKNYRFPSSEENVSLIIGSVRNLERSCNNLVDSATSVSKRRASYNSVFQKKDTLTEWYLMTDISKEMFLCDFVSKK
jgi:hypothetical protein